MRYLYDAGTWTVDEPERAREYVIHDDGEVLANATRVPIRRPDDDIAPYPNPHAMYDQTRTIVCVAGTDGTPYFYVDRINDDQTHQQPAFVVAPNGARIGLIAVSVGGIGGIAKLLSGSGGARRVLRAADGTELATLEGPPRANPQAEGVITDMSGQEIARYRTTLSPYNPRRRRHTMALHAPVPEPLHTLVLASLIGMELTTPEL